MLSNYIRQRLAGRAEPSSTPTSSTNEHWPLKQIRSTHLYTWLATAYTCGLWKLNEYVNEFNFWLTLVNLMDDGSLLAVFTACFWIPFKRPLCNCKRWKCWMVFTTNCFVSRWWPTQHFRYTIHQHTVAFPSHIRISCCFMNWDCHLNQFVCIVGYQSPKIAVCRQWQWEWRIVIKTVLFFSAVYVIASVVIYAHGFHVFNESESSYRM